MIRDKKIIHLFNNSTKIRSEVLYESKGTVIKVLTPKQCFKDYQQLLHKQKLAITQKTY